MATPKHEPPRGILAGNDDCFELRRYHPAEFLRPLVEHYWLVRWDLGGRPEVRQSVLPHPSIHLVVEPERADVVGVVEGRFERVLEGCGRVLGIKLRPGAFAAFTEQPIHELTGRTLPLARMFGAPADDYAHALRKTEDDEALTRLADEFLRDRGPRLPRAAGQARDLVEAVEADPTLSTLEALTRSSGLGARTLQRLFRRYVGVSPKWVILRYRLHEALARLERGDLEDWAAFAVELGYFDQAHFIRHFKQLVGSTPAQYVRNARSTQTADRSG